MVNKPTLKDILPQLKSWCAVNNVSVQSVYDSCHGMTLQELVYYLFSVVKNAVESQVNLEGKFDELYKYVHDYFDNLDVQDEINKKLDEMYNNGKLAELINDLISEKGIGNREFEWTDSGYTPLEHLNTGSFINNRIERSPTSGNEGAAPNVIYQANFNYTDDSAVANENFKYPMNALFDAHLRGHSANTDEASTQNYSNVLSYVKHDVAGIVGTVCFGGRVYTPSVSDVPEIAQFGGNKCAVYDGHAFTDTETQYGGYVLGAELGVYDRVTTGTFPVYNNSDYHTFRRPTTVLNIAGGGNTQPITEGIRIMKFGSGQSGMWNGIYIGASAFEFGEGEGYYPGTVGINMAGWTKTRRGADTGIKFAGSNRHLEFTAGARIGCNTWNVFGRNTTDMVTFRVIAPSDNRAVIMLAGSDDPSVRDNVAYTDNGFLEYNSSMQSVNVVGIQHALRIMERDANRKYHGIYIDTVNCKPINDNETQLGSEDTAWSSVNTHNVHIIDGQLRVGNTTLNETQLKQLLASL